MLRISMHGRSTVEACAGVPGRRVMVSYHYRVGHANLMNTLFCFRRMLAREQEVAEIRMYQPAHVNNAGEHCHKVAEIASTARKGQSHPRGKKAKPAPVRCPASLPRQARSRCSEPSLTLFAVKGWRVQLCAEAGRGPSLVSAPVAALRSGLMGCMHCRMASRRRATWPRSCRR